MKTTKEFNKFLSELTLGIFLVSILNPVPAIAATTSTDTNIIYPLKEISQLDCRYQDFSELNSSCKQDLPILNTKDYTKYATQNWWYNEYTRIYTVLWGSSYKYGWDVWNGWHTWVDIATSKWTPVYSIANWKILQAEYDTEYWNVVSIQHTINWKTIISNYWHLSELNVKKWDSVNAWDKIWEVGSTWNSTWNHLHFQIDYKSTSYPAYYSYNTCPYSYYNITETWVCFNQLETFTIDPLLFLETKWAILNNVVTSNNTNISPINNSNSIDIFNTTVYIWYSKTDIIEVQKVFKELWYYNWELTWNYEDIINDIIKYQIDKKIIVNKDEDWAGRFGPKTRIQTKNDYLLAINKSWNTSVIVDNITTDTVTDTTTNLTSTTVKISRKNLLTREQIEAKEVEDFLKNYNIDLKLTEIWWNIEIWKAINLKLEITDKKGKAFRWNMPSWMTFIIDESKVSVFPQKLYYFTDWKRDIILTWLSPWNTILYIKVWTQTIKTIPIKVYSNKNKIWVSKWTILWINKIYIWEQKTSIILFQDKTWAKLINLTYNWSFQLKTNEDAKICMKSWNIKNIKNIYSKWCSDEEFQDYKNFTYSDTVWWLVIFNYKVTWDNPQIELINLNDNSKLSTKNIVVLNPKWLDLKYEYTNEVIELLNKWIVNWINKWYFQENNELTEYDALSWIRNTLINMNEDSEYYSQKSQIEKNLKEVYNLRLTSSHFITIEREKFLDLNYKYLVLNKSNSSITIKYKDLDDEVNKMANLVFDSNNTWKDKFWVNYFRPNTKITRWEWAYMLKTIIQKNAQVLLTIK